MLIIPATPSASYFAPGSVITCISFTVLAGMLRRTSFGLLEIMLEGFPFRYILKLVDPFSCTLSSPSTVTIGTFFNISNRLFVVDSGSLSILYTILSRSTFTSGFCAETITSDKAFSLSLIYIVPRSTIFASPTTTGLTRVFLPIYSTVSRYSPFLFIEN